MFTNSALIRTAFARGPVHTVRIECLRVFETVEWLENLYKNLLLVSFDGRTLSEERDSREVSGQCEPIVAASS